MGFQDKQSALTALEEARADYVTAARSFLERHPIGTRLTVDDVRRACPVPEGIDPRVMGAVFKSPCWEPVQFTNSARRTCHKRPIRIFERVQ